MIICDTGPLLAAANGDDSEHAVCLAVLSNETGPLIVPATIVTEVCFMLARLSAHAEATFLRALAAEELRVEPLIPADYARMADLVVQYGKFPLGAADASVIAVAERLDVTTVATLDHRHFRSAPATASRSNSFRANTNWPATSGSRTPGGPSDCRGRAGCAQTAAGGGSGRLDPLVRDQTARGSHSDLNDLEMTVGATRGRRRRSAPAIDACRTRTARISRDSPARAGP